MEQIPSWSLYFSPEEHTTHNDNITHIQTIKKMLKPPTQSLLTAIHRSTTFTITKKTFLAFLKNDTFTTLKCISCAVSDILTTNGYPTVQLKLRIVEVGDSQSFNDINTENVGKLIVLTGTVCRIGTKKVELKKIHFECVRCKELTVILADSGVYRQPRKCKGSCKSRLFNVLMDNVDLKCRDFQEIKIQENFYASRMPQVVEAVLYDEFVGSAGPGDVIKLVGIVKAEAESKDLYKLGISVINICTDDVRLDNLIDNRSEIELTNITGLNNNIINKEELNNLIDDRSEMDLINITGLNNNIINKEELNNLLDDRSEIELINITGLNNNIINKEELNNLIDDRNEIELINITGLKNNILNKNEIDSTSVEHKIKNKSVVTKKNGNVITNMDVWIEENKENLHKKEDKILNIGKNKNFTKQMDKRYTDPKSINNFNEIKKVSETKNLIKIIIHTVFPDVFGNEIIKIGLILAIFGGSEKYADECRIRETIHCLIIGDPGLGKSKMLLSICDLLPKTSYVTGNLTTTAGLTVSLAHDPGSGDFVVEAGALVLADGGLCCLDEFDKIGNHKCLFEVMEDQKVTVAKAGVVCTVPARTTVVAATNPKFGHFKKDSGIEKNIKFDEALLSRFDLVFVLFDTLDESHNSKVCNFILNTHEKENHNLIERIRRDKFLGDFSNPMESEKMEINLLKDYLVYARNAVSPVLSTQAKYVLTSYFNSIKEGTTVRALESLIRLCEAKAKVELRSIATKNDAEFVVELYKRTLFKEEKKVEKKGIKGFVEMLRKIVVETGQEVVTLDEIVSIMKKADITKSRDEFVEMLNYKGILLKKGKCVYQVVLN